MARDPYKYFRIEARELLEQFGKALLELEKSSNAERVPQLLRLAHTLKGAARVVKQREIADQAHAIEDVLAPYRHGSGAVARADLDAVLGRVDDMSNRVAALSAPNEPEGAPSARIRPDDQFRTIRTEVAEMDALLSGITEAHGLLGGLRKTLTTVTSARHFAQSLSDRLSGLPDRPGLPRENGASRDSTRLMAEQLNRLLNKLERGLTPGLDRIDREMRQVWNDAERLRLIPAGVLFTTLERTARDVARALGKKVVFEGQGSDVRLDAHVIGALQGALLQVVRNAVAHGIEEEAARKSAGKPPEGRVTLQVARRGRRVAFTCSDDGRGVDLEAVRRAAERKSPLSTQMQGLGPEDLLRLLLKGGISTSGVVTEVSGRGIGLDVLREAAERLGGEVLVQTEPNKGTTVTLIVPLSVASIEALVIEASGVIAAIPLDAVRQTRRIAPEEVTRTAAGESVIHEGKIIPFMPIARALSRNLSPAGGPRVWPAVVVQAGNGLAAIGVDRLLGTTNVMVRPLPELAPAAPVVAGASLDSTGIPQLVLDPDELVSEAERGIATVFDEAPLRRPVLIVDDSLTTRMLEQSILESAGYEVDAATSGEEALEMASRRRYALFLVDVEMPGMDGFTFLERAKTDPGLKEIPSILVTSRASREDRRRGAEVGAGGYIVKSEFDQGQLLEQIRKLVEQP